MGSLLILILSACRALPSLEGSSGTLDHLVYVCPSAGSEWQSTGTPIILGFDEPPPGHLALSAEGSLSGSLSMSEYRSADGLRLVLTPDRPLRHGETVRVRAVSATGGSISWSFATRPVDPVRPRPDMVRPDPGASVAPETPLPAPTGAPGANSVALPSDFPDITFNPSGSQSPGNFFFTPFNLSGGGNTSTYLVMADSDGEVLFYRHGHMPFYNFELQSDGRISFVTTNMYSDSICWIELDETYTKVDSFAVIGYPTDNHDFTVADNGNYLLIGRDERYVDMSQVVPGGNPDALVVGLLIQEQDQNHMPVFQWSSFDHFEITDACDYVDLTGAYVDYVHCNSLDEDADGGLIVSCLAMTECTKIDRTTGELVWRFGGYLSDNPDFDIVGDPLGGFSSQHDFRHVSGSLYSVFDNGTHHTPKISRACIYDLDTGDMTAELVWSWQSTGLYGSHMGSTQVLPGGGVVVGWGDVTGFVARPDISEISPSGQVLFSGRMNLLAMESYRAYKFDWEGQAVVPYLVALVPAGQSHVELTYNVFGDDEYASYDIYRGAEPGDLAFLLNTPLRQISLWDLPTGMNYFAVRARDSQGVATGFSNVDSALVTWTGIGEGAGVEVPGGLRLHPCPASTAVTIEWPAAPGAPVSVLLFDIAGRVVCSAGFEAPRDGCASFTMPVASLPDGVYIVTTGSPGLRAARMAVLH